METLLNRFGCTPRTRDLHHRGHGNGKSYTPNTLNFSLWRKERDVLPEYKGEGHGAMREAVDEESFVFTLEEVQNDHSVHISVLR